MVKISQTPVSMKFMHWSLVTDGFQEDEHESSPWFSHKEIADIASKIRTRHNHTTVSYGLDVLLQGSEIYIPRKPSKPELPADYRALMDSLRRDQEEKQYAAMTGAKTREESTGIIAKEVSDQISVIFNILFSSAFTGLAVWYATANLTNWKRHEPLRVGLSMLVALVVAIAEVSLYNGYKRKMADATKKEKATAEVKFIIEVPK